MSAHFYKNVNEVLAVFVSEFDDEGKVCLLFKPSASNYSINIIAYLTIHDIEKLFNAVSEAKAMSESKE